MYECIMVCMHVSYIVCMSIQTPIPVSTRVFMHIYVYMLLHTHRDTRGGSPCAGQGQSASRWPCQCPKGLMLPVLLPVGIWKEGKKAAWSEVAVSAQICASISLRMPYFSYSNWSTKTAVTKIPPPALTLLCCVSEMTNVPLYFSSNYERKC